MRHFVIPYSWFINQIQHIYTTFHSCLWDQKFTKMENILFPPRPHCDKLRLQDSLWVPVLGFLDLFIAFFSIKMISVWVGLWYIANTTASSKVLLRFDLSLFHQSQQRQEIFLQFYTITKISSSALWSEKSLTFAARAVLDSFC